MVGRPKSVHFSGHQRTRPCLAAAADVAPESVNSRNDECSSSDQKEDLQDGPPGTAVERITPAGRLDEFQTGPIGRSPRNESSHNVHNMVLTSSGRRWCHKCLHCQHREQPQHYDDAGRTDERTGTTSKRRGGLPIPHRSISRHGRTRYATCVGPHSLASANRAQCGSRSSQLQYRQ